MRNLYNALMDWLGFEVKKEIARSIQTPDYTQITFEKNSNWHFVIAGEWAVEELLAMYPNLAYRMRGKYKISWCDHPTLPDAYVQVIHFFRPRSIWDHLKALGAFTVNGKYKVKSFWYGLPVSLQLLARVVFFPLELLLTGFWMIMLAVIYGLVAWPMLQLANLHEHLEKKKKRWNSDRIINKQIRRMGDQVSVDIKGDHNVVNF